MTKLGMARFIVQVLYNLDNAPPEDHFHVKKIARVKKADVADLYNLAIEANVKRIIQNRKYDNG